MQCPGCVCAALAADLRGRVWCRYSLVPLGSSLPSRPSRCLWRVVPSGCPFPLPAGTPFHAVCAFRGLGRVALWVRAACPSAVAPLVLPRCTPPPPPGLVWRAHYARSWCRALVSPFQAVRAPWRFLSRSSAPRSLVGRAWPGPCAPLPGSGLSPRRRACASQGVQSLGGVEVGKRPGYRPPTGRGLIRVGRRVSGGRLRWRRSDHGGRKMSLISAL